MASCFAYKKDSNGKFQCKAIVASCDGTDTRCEFYKTKEQHNLDKEEALKRIATLPAHLRRMIAETYYHGERPWQKYVTDNDDGDFQEMKGTAVYQERRPVFTGRTEGALDDAWKEVLKTLDAEVMGLV